MATSATQTTVFSLSRLLGYGALGLPLAALNLPLFVYLPTFYAEELGLSLATVGLVLLAARLFDVISDPVIGELSDRTRTRFGRRLPWLVAAAPILLFASWMLFIPPADAGATHLLVWSLLAYLGWTAMILCYGALGAELSADYHERTRLTSAREGCVVLGILIAAAIPVMIGAEPGSGAGLKPFSGRWRSPCRSCSCCSSSARPSNRHSRNNRSASSRGWGLPGATGRSAS